jgi:hypothetical protein
VSVKNPGSTSRDQIGRLFFSTRPPLRRSPSLTGVEGEDQRNGTGRAARPGSFLPCVTARPPDSPTNRAYIYVERPGVIGTGFLSSSPPWRLQRRGEQAAHLAVHVAFRARRQPVPCPASSRPTRPPGDVRLVVVTSPPRALASVSLRPV